MPETKGKIYRAKDSFQTEVNGQTELIRAGVTLVREGHPLLAGRESLFEEVELDYEWEDASTEKRAR